MDGLKKLFKLRIWHKVNLKRHYWTIYPFYIHIDYWPAHDGYPLYFRVWKA